MRFVRFRNASLIIKVLVLSLLMGALLWWLLDYFQRRELRDDFQSQLQEQLEFEATVDRNLFDRHVRGIHYSAQLISSQNNLLNYLHGERWKAVVTNTEVEHHYQPPVWLPPNSILRTFFQAHDAMLMSADGQVREIYHSGLHKDGEPILPPGLSQPNNLLRKLSHSQAYLTSLDGEPYVISSQEIHSESGELIAILVLGSAIDEDFLYGAKESGVTNSVLALLDVQGKRIVASSDPRALPRGTLVDTLKRDYLMIGKSFFDYGASDLELQLASFIATSRSEQFVAQLLAKEGRQRAILALILILFFTMLTVFIALRIKQLNSIVDKLSRDFLGINTQRGSGDEIRQLENQFKQLADKLNRADSENVSLHGRVIDTENESRSLRLVTELLSVGVVVDTPGGLVPFNHLMESLVVDYGGAEPFLLQDKKHAEIHLVDRHGNARSFGVDQHEALGPRGILVRETTVQLRIKEERDQFANFPAYSPNPVVHIDRKGNVLYANIAMQGLLGRLGSGQIDRIPDEWRHKLDQHNATGMTSELEVSVGRRDYTFVVALLGGDDAVYLFGQDVTDRREAERKLKLAATVTRNVLDGIIITDTGGIVQQINPAFSDISGYTENELRGKALDVLFASRSDAALQEEMWLEVKKSGSWQGEVWKQRKDGTSKFCLVRMNAIRDDSGLVSNYVVVYSDITERKQHEQWLAHIAFHDPLTRLPNRRLLEDRLEQNITQAQRNSTSLAVLYLDLDGFKPVNDSLGHDIGDKLLCEVAQRLRDCVRGSDTVSRVGGDEFIIVLPEFTTQALVHDVAQKAIDGLHLPFMLAGESVGISASIGIAIYPQDGDTAAELIKAADRAMYEVKHSGKNAYKIG
jgi:diguanylate cyclase (GGDEF)-like protein/PAS domain S-box-containing protein